MLWKIKEDFLGEVTLKLRFERDIHEHMCVWKRYVETGGAGGVTYPKAEQTACAES